MVVKIARNGFIFSVLVLKNIRLKIRRSIFVSPVSHLWMNLMMHHLDIFGIIMPKSVSMRYLRFISRVNNLVSIFRNLPRSLKCTMLWWSGRSKQIICWKSWSKRIQYKYDLMSNKSILYIFNHYGCQQFITKLLI